MTQNTEITDGSTDPASGAATGPIAALPAGDLEVTASGGAREVRRRISILPRYGISLPAYAEGDRKRFARLFGETWRSIPLGARRSMLGHWRRHSRPKPARRYPHITTLDFLKVDEAIGSCGNYRCELEFLSYAVDMMPDDCVRTLIAHELAHVALVAPGRYHRDYTDDYVNPYSENFVLDPVAQENNNRLNDLEEYEVFQLLLDWNFDDTVIDEWLKNGGRAAIASGRDAVERMYTSWAPNGEEVALESAADIVAKTLPVLETGDVPDAHDKAL